VTCESNQKSNTNADLTVNGKKIELNSFVESFTYSNQADLI